MISLESMNQIASSVNDANPFLMAMSATIAVESEDILNRLRETADDEGYPKDFFVECVLDEIRRLMKDE